MYFCKNTGIVNKNGSCQCRKRNDDLDKNDVGCYFDKRCKGVNPCGTDAAQPSDGESSCPSYDEIETQENHMCGMHAINNVFGKQIVTPELLDQESKKERNRQNRSLH